MCGGQGEHPVLKCRRIIFHQGNIKQNVFNRNKVSNKCLFASDKLITARTEGDIPRTAFKLNNRAKNFQNTKKKVAFKRTNNIIDKIVTNDKIIEVNSFNYLEYIYFCNK